MADGKEPGVDVCAPELDEKGGSWIRVKAVEEPENGQDVEYAISKKKTAPDKGWGEELRFDELVSSRTYYIFARSQENSRYYAGAPCEGLKVKTKWASGEIDGENGLVEGSLWGVVGASVEVNAVSVAASFGKVYFGLFEVIVSLANLTAFGAGIALDGVSFIRVGGISESTLHHNRIGAMEQALWSLAEQIETLAKTTRAVKNKTQTTLTQRCTLLSQS